MKVLITLMLIGLAGCVSSKPVPLPDGSDGYMVNCGTEDGCLVEAAKVCGRYELLRTSQTTNSLAGVGSETEFHWLIKCTE